MRKRISVLVAALVLVLAVSSCGGATGSSIDTLVGVSALSSLADSHITCYLNTMQAVAETQEVQSGDWEAMKPLLQGVALTDVTALVWYLLPDGSYYTVEQDKADGNLSDRAYFPGLMDGDTVAGDLVFSKATGRKSVIAAVPIVKDDVVVGALGASIFLDDLSDTLSSEIALPDDLVFYALGEDDEVAVHSDTAVITAENPELPANVVQVASPLTGWRFALGYK